MVVPPKGIHFDEMYQPPEKPKPRPMPTKPASDLLVPKWDNPPPTPISEREPAPVPEPVSELKRTFEPEKVYEDNKPEAIEVLVTLGYKRTLAKQLAYDACVSLPPGASTESILAEVFRANRP